MEIGERITLALQLKGVKTKDLVDIFGISQQYVSNIKRADKINDTIAQIATHFNINLNWLIMGQGEMFIADKTNAQNIQTVSGGQNAQNVHGDMVGSESKKETNIKDIDSNTLGLFIESYQKAKEKDDIKGLRIYLMDY